MVNARGSSFEVPFSQDFPRCQMPGAGVLELADCASHSQSRRPDKCQGQAWISHSPFFSHHRRLPPNNIFLRWLDQSEFAALGTQEIASKVADDALLSRFEDALDRPSESSPSIKPALYGLEFLAILFSMAFGTRKRLRTMSRGLYLG